MPLSMLFIRTLRILQGSTEGTINSVLQAPSSGSEHLQRSAMQVGRGARLTLDLSGTFQDRLLLYTLDQGSHPLS